MYRCITWTMSLQHYLLATELIETTVFTFYSVSLHSMDLRSIAIVLSSCTSD